MYIKNFKLPELCKECNDESKKACIICGTMVDEKTTEKGICQKCLNAYRIVKCSKCGRDIRYYGRQEYLEKKLPPSRCDKSQVYTTKTCCDCGTQFEITVGEKEFYDKQGFELSKRCKACKQQNSAAGKSSSKPHSNSLYSTSYVSKSYTSPRPQNISKSTPSKNTIKSNATTKVGSQELLTKKKETATKETEKYFDKLKNIAERKLGFFAKISFKSKSALGKFKILRLIDSSRSKYDIADFIYDIRDKISDLHSACLEDLDDFLEIIEDIVESAEMYLED